MKNVDLQWVGCVDYLAAWEQQKALVIERSENPDVDGKLLLLEHPHTYTLGRNGRLQNLLLSEDQLNDQRIAFYQVDRGGDITYHGPGQLVGYPILPLKRIYARPGLGVVRRYINDLEEMLIQAVAQFGVTAQRLEGHRGVWVETSSGVDKLAAIGVRIQKDGISSHGFALNVNPDLTYFDHIIPCGISDHGVVSLAQLLPHSITIADVLPHLITAFSTVFQVQLHTEDRTVSGSPIPL